MINSPINNRIKLIIQSKTYATLNIDQIDPFIILIESLKIKHLMGRVNIVSSALSSVFPQTTVHSISQRGYYQNNHQIVN